MSVDPKNYRQCWSCRHCSDLGEQSYEEYVTYLRKCSHARLDLLDKVPLHCEYYSWDGKTREYWKELPSYSSASGSKSSSAVGNASEGNTAAIVAIAAALIVIGFVVFLFFRPAKVADLSEPNSVANTPVHSEATEPDLADYSLAGQPRYVRTQSGKGVYLRAEPATNAEVIAGIPDNEVAIIQKTLDSWAYVSWDIYEGWCKAEYLITEEEHTRQMLDFLNIPAIVATETDPLRLREAPSMSGTPIESMPKGSQVIVLRLEGDWAYVEYQGISGWCASAYLDIQE